MSERAWLLVAELRSALASARSERDVERMAAENRGATIVRLTARAERAERERDEARFTLPETQRALANALERAGAAERERDAARSEVEHWKARADTDEASRLEFERDASRLRAERASLEERLDAALARLHETREATGRASKAWAAWVKHRDHDCPGLTNGDPCDDYSDNCGGEAIWDELEAALVALAPSPSTTPETRGEATKEE